MEKSTLIKWQSDRLIFMGLLLFLAGLLIALAIPQMTNPRMGLSAHLEGTMNGMFLAILGIIWNRPILNEKWLSMAFWLALYGAFANFLAVSMAAVTGAGKLMPIAGGKESGSFDETLISFLLITLAIAMIAVCAIILTGLFRYLKQNTAI